MDFYHYDCNLNIENFVHMLDDTTECYKFYWFESILDILASGKTVMSFEEIIDKMIADAWYSVDECHLHLGPRDATGKVMNSIERAILKLSLISKNKIWKSKEDVLLFVKENEKLIHEERYQLSKNVPYRLLSSFVDNIGGNDAIWDQKKRLITYFEMINKEKCIPYTILDGRGLRKQISISPQWEKMLLDNFVSIRGWIQNKKIKYLQQRNPSVPGIIYKLEPDNEKIRKLKYARNIWSNIMKIEGIEDIYTTNKLDENDYELDHFIPWSYIANDELWNLLPMNSSLNSSKSNKLSDWTTFSGKFIEKQYLLYDIVFHRKCLQKEFEQCRRDNVVSIWSNEELYIPDLSKGEFCNMLEQHMNPIYDAAKIQGYSTWVI